MTKYGQRIAAMGLVLCLALSGAVGFAEETQTGALEGVMAQMQEAESMTIDAQFALRQNGGDQITGDVLFQMSSDTQYASANVIHMDGEARDMEMSKAEGTHIFRIGDEFYAMPVAEDEENETADVTLDDAAERAALPADITAYMNMVVEQLFGTATEKLTVTEDGVSLHLAGDEVPAILNLAVSMAGHFQAEMPTAAVTTTMMHGTKGAAPEADEEVMPAMSLGINLRIDRIDLDVAMENDFISGIQFSIVLMGEDEAGAALETELACVIRITDVNATEPANVDTTGVEMKPYNNKPHRRMMFAR